jgi:hypothetical protein
VRRFQVTKTNKKRVTFAGIFIEIIGMMENVDRGNASSSYTLEGVAE